MLPRRRGRGLAPQADLHRGAYRHRTLQRGGERAAALCGGRAASFKVAFIDELYRATPDDIANNPLRVEGRPSMNTLIAVAIAPFGVGDELSSEVAEVVKVIRESGLPNRTYSMFTEIEGEWDEVMRVVRDTQRSCLPRRAFAPRSS